MQHLRIKAFYGTSENAVTAQIWRLESEPGLHQILQILSVTLFEKTPILQAFDDADSQVLLPPLLTN